MSGVCRYFVGTLTSSRDMQTGVRDMQVLCRYPNRYQGLCRYFAGTLTYQGYAEIDLLGHSLSFPYGPFIKIENFLGVRPLI